MKNSENFQKYVHHLNSQFPAQTAEELFAHPEQVAISSVDMTNAFCRVGNLSSDRVAAIIDPITDLMRLAWEHGVRHFLLAQDCHSPQAEEFGSYAPHAVCGTTEAEAVDEIKALPFYDAMTIFEKNSIDPSQNTGLDAWIENHPQVNTYVVVGDCTDLCVYQTVMHLRTFANARDLDWRVVAPANCIETYDLPLDKAEKLGVMPHAGDFLHHVFLYHMLLNGVEVVEKIT